DACRRAKPHGLSSYRQETHRPMILRVSVDANSRSRRYTGRKPVPLRVRCTERHRAGRPKTRPVRGPEHRNTPAPGAPSATHKKGAAADPTDTRLTVHPSGDGSGGPSRQPVRKVTQRSVIAALLYRAAMHLPSPDTIDRIAAQTADDLRRLAGVWAARGAAAL